MTASSRGTYQLGQATANVRLNLFVARETSKVGIGSMSQASIMACVAVMFPVRHSNRLSGNLEKATLVFR
jgi:hypothetical protein